MLSLLENEMYRKKIKFALLLFAVFFLSWRIAFVPLYDSDKARGALRGDGYSDKNVHSTAMYMYDYGFTKSYLLPVFNYKGDGDTTKAGVYTHYPCIPDLLGGVYAKILQTKSDRTIRLFPLLISIAFFFFIFYTLNYFLKNPIEAFISACVIVLSNYFLAFGDSLHKHLYEEFGKWIVVYLLYKYYTTHKSLLLLGLLSFLMVIESNISFEPIAYIAVVVIGFSWIFEKKIFTSTTIALGIATFIGFGLHMYQNYLFFNDWEKVYVDMKGSAVMRVTGEGINSEMTEVSLHDYLQIPFLWINRLERSFLFPGWALLFPIYLLLKKWRKEQSVLFQISIVLFIASIIWSFLMSQHYIVHGFTSRHFGLLYALLIGPAILCYFAYLKNGFKTFPIYLKTIHIGIICYALVMMGTYQIYELYIRYRFTYPHLGK